MSSTLIEKIMARHSKKDRVKPGQIVDIRIDTRAARDFGGANVVKNLEDHGLEVADRERTFFTFDCNPGGSDQKYAANQHLCRQFARRKGIRVYDINQGIGTHLAIDAGMVSPGSTFVSTDSHANIMGAVGAFGQGLGDKDMAAVWAKGSVWFKVPPSIRITLEGKRPPEVTAKDMVLNLLAEFGSSTLLGYAVEFAGPAADQLSLDERITIASMGTEMGALTLLFEPGEKVLRELKGDDKKSIMADPDAHYERTITLNIEGFVPRVSLPGRPHDTLPVQQLEKTRIDSAFIGSCTNGRMEDLRAAAEILRNRKVAPWVVLKIVPATDRIWKQALDEGLIQAFKDAGALVANAGCAGCAAGQVGQNGPGEVTISAGNRNFAGKQGKGKVFLASPQTVTASAVAGYITTHKQIPEQAEEKPPEQKTRPETKTPVKSLRQKSPITARGDTWHIQQDDMDTDMIFHNRYLHITEMKEMGQYALDNLEGYEDFAEKAKPGEIIITGKNFGAGSSRQQAVDCFKALGISCILAESYGAIYERNAINAAFPLLVYQPEMLETIDYKSGDPVEVNFLTGEITNLRNDKKSHVRPFHEVQTEIYQRGGLLYTAE